MTGKTLKNWGESVSTRGGALQACCVWLLCDSMVKKDMSNPLNKLYEAHSFVGGGDRFSTTKL